MSVDPTIDTVFRKETRVASPRASRRWRVWAAVAAVAGLGASILIRHGGNAPPPGAKIDAVPVAVGSASRADVDVILSALGTVTPLSTVAVKTQISGRVTQIGFAEGQMVKEGDFLAEIDPRPYRHALRQAQGQLMRDKALLDNARLDLERYKRLVAQNSVSRQQLDTQASLVRQYEGTVEIDEGNVQNAQLNLDYCRISAPITGRVGLRQIDLGNYVQAGGDSLVTLTKLQPIAVVFPLAEDHLPQLMRALRAGEKPRVAIYDRSGRKAIAQGEIAGVDAAIDPTTGTVKFKAEFDNTDLSLFPNQFVSVRVTAETLKDAIVVPTSGVQYGPKGAFAYLVSDDGAALMRLLEVGLVQGERTVVISGVAPGERLVVAGADRLRDGVKVKAIEE